MSRVDVFIACPLSKRPSTDENRAIAVALAASLSSTGASVFCVAARTEHDQASEPRFAINLAAVETAGAFVLIMCGSRDGRSSIWIELGAAFVLHKPVFIVCDALESLPLLARLAILPVASGGAGNVQVLCCDIAASSERLVPQTVDAVTTWLKQASPQSATGKSIQPQK